MLKLSMIYHKYHIYLFKEKITSDDLVWWALPETPHEVKLFGYLYFLSIKHSHVILLGDDTNYKEVEP